MHHDSPATRLLECAAHGMESAWQDIVKRFSPLISTVCRRHGISGVDIQDVAGEVWLRLLANARTIRDPEALPGWLLTTTRNECLRLLHTRSRQIPTDTGLSGEPCQPGLDARLIDDERRHAARQALAHLSQRDRQLLAMLFSDPPTPYKEISAALGIPVGAIGPTRARCLARARRTPAVAALVP
jgi:RNA polymerase sigma factor (sigma-70 family)